eukprot:2587125-Pyramimonas_sp.AAC.1
MWSLKSFSTLKNRSLRPSSGFTCPCAVEATDPSPALSASFFALSAANTAWLVVALLPTLVAPQ